MREKLLAQLITKYPGVSKKFLGLWADKLAAKVTEESQIEGAINELDNLPVSIQDLATEFQKEGDNRVTVAKKEWLKNPPKPDKPTDKTDDTPPNPDQPTDDVPAWAKSLIDSNKALAEKLQGIEAEKAQKTIKEKIAESLKASGVPEQYWSKMALPAKEDEIETFTTSVSQDWVNLGLSTSTKPVVGGGAGANGTPTKEQLDAVINNF